MCLDLGDQRQGRSRYKILPIANRVAIGRRKKVGPTVKIYYGPVSLRVSFSGQEGRQSRSRVIGDISGPDVDTKPIASPQDGFPV